MGQLWPLCQRGKLGRGRVDCLRSSRAIALRGCLPHPRVTCAPPKTEETDGRGVCARLAATRRGRRGRAKKTHAGGPNRARPCL